MERRTGKIRGAFSRMHGFGRLEAGLRAGFASSRPPPQWTSVFQFSSFLYDVFFFFFFLISLRACINDVRKIKIGKNQNQNWVLIGRGSKPPDYASLFFGNCCQTKEVPRT